MDANSALNGGDSNAALNGALAGNMNAARSRYQTDLNAEQKDMQPSINRFNATASQPMPTVPEPKKAAPAPDAQAFNKDAQGWVTALAALSALVGARGRARGTGALKAFAGGLKGLQEGNQKAFDNAYKTWKGDTDAMMEENKQEMDKYKAVLENRNLSEQEAFDEIKMVGFQHQNKLMMDAKDFEQTAGIYESAVKAQVGAEASIKKIQQMADARQEQYEKVKEDYKKDTASQTELNTYMNGGKPLLAGYGMARQAKQDALDEMAHDKDPNFDYTTAQAKLQAFKQGAGQLSKQVETVTFASNELDKSLPSLMAITQKYQLGNFKTANEAYRYMQDKYPSSEDFKNFDTQMRAVKSAYALFIGRGASRGTVHSDEEAGKIADTDMGTMSMGGFIQGVNTERRNALDGANQTIKDWYATKGGTASPLPTTDTPDAGAPAVGTIEDGHRFKGGDPASPDSWEPL